ncbi:unnamed protein product [Microthlaspi erraticum]|uniref:FBD domain-containing protein n=1 Tax=Microthlaspi erraticum TaxID=1685480 RepID=A0A6D2ITN3_9BRAS|nr:unnamed protein product [Microthlaspi erraticum]
MDMKMINDLGDDVLRHIISFLPIREAAFTSLLSNRWRYMFALPTNLRLDYDEEVCGRRRPEYFIEFVDRVLARSGNIPTRKISIKFRKSIDSRHVNRWMTKVLQHGLLNLDIDVIFGHDYYVVPLETFFTCKNMVELKLGKGFLATLPGDVSLPSLKKLYLDSVYFTNSGLCVSGKLLSACPVLEELTMLEGEGTWKYFCINVSSFTLKKLTIKCNEGSHIRDMTLDTPNLVYLEYSGFVKRNYPTVSLESLVEAKLGLLFERLVGIDSLYRSLYTGRNPTNLIKGLRNVEVLELSSLDTWEKVFSYFREAIPVFSNLVRLSVKIPLSYHYCDWEPLLLLVKKSPNLKTLVIKGPREWGERDYGLSCPVKVLKTTCHGGKTGELQQMKYFIEELPCLELIEVCAYAINDEEKSRITLELLLMVPKPLKCNIQIMFCQEGIS